MRAAVVAAFGAALLARSAPPALGQQGRVDPSAADVAIARGRLAEAEAALYAAAARAPREPSARGALGEFLAARGRLKVGAVLLEEARLFGGDRRAIDERLKHIFSWLGEWPAVAALSAAAFDGAEHERARWLAAHPGTRRGPDSSAVRLEPNELFGLGSIAIVVGTDTLHADIDPTLEGLALPATSAVFGASQLFVASRGATLAVVSLVTLGEFALYGVPARLESVPRARVGLDVLAPLTPTFDAAARRLTLRSAAAVARGAEIPFLLGFPGVRLAAREGQAPVAIESAAGRAALRGARWTFDLARGAVIVER